MGSWIHSSAHKQTGTNFKWLPRYLVVTQTVLLYGGSDYIPDLTSGRTILNGKSLYSVARYHSNTEQTCPLRIKSQAGQPILRSDARDTGLEQFVHRYIHSGCVLIRWAQIMHGCHRLSYRQGWRVHGGPGMVQLNHPRRWRGLDQAASCCSDRPRCVGLQYTYSSMR